MNGAAETIRRVVAALDAAGARHMIVGSFASTLHGEPRTTQDIERWGADLGGSDLWARIAGN